jgi:hypothetical protein
MQIAMLHPKTNEIPDFLTAGVTFFRMVEVRNAIMHGKPGINLQNEQRLFAHGKEWTISSLEEAADGFADNAAEFNAFYYGHLS